ncbi:MAG: class I SAM-dependent methyltransferase [Luteolibacter sp.]|uniref:class I SAM-dependent methyltransferase n=1 Tax=Luteolibacter sp. TaxID=1962973 RepID=UPI00326590F2
MNPADPMFPPRPTALAQELLRPVIRPGDVVIDATAGNGHDTVFLAECVGESGRVLAFDVQEAALVSARERVASAGFKNRVKFLHESHVRMGEHVEAGSVAAVMFNLGYLPGEDHNLTTEGQETLAALEEAGKLLKPGGVLSVICYPGHPAGALEAAAVETWMAALANSGWRVARYGAVGTKRPAPFLLMGRR